MPGFTPLNLAPLRAHAWLAGVEHHAALDSTNRRAQQLAEQNPPLPQLILAEHQTAGRGRGNHTWWTGPGSLAMSLLLDARAIGLSAEQRLRVSLAAAVAVLDAVRPILAAHVSPAELGLHWPNDIYAAGRKLAGILVEGLSDGRLILGIGVNTNNTLRDAPPELHGTAATLRDLTGNHVDATEFLLALLDHLRARLHALAERPQALGEEFQARCLQRGKILALKQGAEIIRGRCHDIAADGALVLDTTEGRRSFYSGMLVPP